MHSEDGAEVVGGGGQMDDDDNDSDESVAMLQYSARGYSQLQCRADAHC